VFDFCYHVANVEEAAEAPTPNDGKVNMPQFFAKVQTARELNNYIFSCLAAYYDVPVTSIMLFQPPSQDPPSEFAGTAVRFPRSGSRAVDPRL
jgi:hypothetical protein